MRAMSWGGTLNSTSAVRGLAPYRNKSHLVKLTHSIDRGGCEGGAGKLEAFRYSLVTKKVFSSECKMRLLCTSFDPGFNNSSANTGLIPE